MRRREDDAAEDAFDRPPDVVRRFVLHGDEVEFGLTSHEREELAAATEAFEAWLETEGWEQEPHLVVVRRTPAERIAAGEAELCFDGVDIGDDLFDAILGLAMGPDDVALLCATEMWAFPPDLPEDQWVGRPSEHPDRREIRLVTVADRTGLITHLVRPRGGDPGVDDELESPLDDYLCAAALQRRR